MLAAWILLLQSEVGIPIERGDSDRVIERLLSVPLDLLSCPTGCAFEPEFPYDSCPKCGVPMSRTTPAGELDRSVLSDRGLYVMRFQGRVNGHALLRLSRIDAALQEAGLKRRDRNLTVRGPFQIHVQESQDLAVLTERLKRVPGVTSARGEGRVLFIRADGADWSAVLGVFSDAPIQDVTWTVNWDQGRMGFGLR